MATKKASVAVIPPSIVFEDAEVGCIHRQTFSVQNCSPTGKEIRFRGPATQAYQMSENRKPNAAKTIAPGLSVTTTVEYYPTAEEEYQDRIVVFVDDKEAIEVPLVGLPPCPRLAVSGSVNFGLVVADGRVLTEEFVIRNDGTRSGGFDVTYGGDQPVKVIPSAGAVRPGESITIKVELIAENPGEHVEELSVSLEGGSLIMIEMFAQIANRSLSLRSVDRRSELKCINFGLKYYGTVSKEHGLLVNHSPYSTSFVGVLEEGGVGEEPGVDLTMSTMATVLASLNRSQRKEYGDSALPRHTVSMIPHQGTIGPYQAIPVTFTFAPRFVKSSQGWLHDVEAAGRRDYALFMHVEPIGVNTDTSVLAGQNPSVEIALTGTALPICLTVQPTRDYDFGDCVTGEVVDILCKLTNDSSLLPACFSVARPAHFRCKPSQGRLEPGETIDFLLTFCPGQLGRLQGTFRVSVFDVNQPQRSVGTIPISATGKCTTGRSTTHQKTKGKTATVDVSVTDGTVTQYSPRVVTKELSQSPTRLLVSTKVPSAAAAAPPVDSSIRFADPNDLATSVRPHNRLEPVVKVPYTKTNRYTYVDPDYAYDDVERANRRRHRDAYVSYLRTTRRERTTTKKGKLNDVDLGIEPAIGLRPIEPKTKEIEKTTTTTKDIDGGGMRTSRGLAELRDVSTSHFVGHALRAVPLTPVEKSDCSRWLSPEELHRIQILPAVVDFGQVCSRSVNTIPVRIVNSLDRFIRLAATVDCTELRQSSSLAQVVPPRSVAELPLVFESHRKGRFQRSLHYTINDHHDSHLVVQADVVDVALHLSAYKVTLRSCPPTGAHQATITLENRRNHPAEFVWIDSSLVDVDNPPVFVVEPSRGVVEAHRNLTCSVAYRPSFDAPLDGNVTLEVKNGNRAKLRCVVELEPIECRFVDRRLMFGVVPLGLETVRSTWIENAGVVDAHFQIVRTIPYAGMTVRPATGSIPAGGKSEIVVAFRPSKAEKFDARIDVRIRGGKSISLRLGGAVETPSVDVNLDAFRFDDVYCGALARQPFQLINRSRVRAQVRFDLSRYRDFGLRSPKRDVQLEGNYVDEETNNYIVNVGPYETAKCQLVFAPQQIAAYDFVLPVVVNGMDPPSAPQSPWPPSPTNSRLGLTDFDFGLTSDSGDAYGSVTPKRRVLATVLKALLNVSHTRLEFDLKSGFLELSLGNPLFHPKGIEMKNASNGPLDWYVDLSCGGQSIDDGTFIFANARSKTPLGSPEAKYPNRVGRTLDVDAEYGLGVAFCPQTSGYFKASLPLYISKSKHPYRIIELRGELESPSITFDPSQLTVMPTPLGIPTFADFKIKAKGFHRGTQVTASLPDLADVLEARDVANVALEYLDGQVVEDAGLTELRCRFTFVSSRPVSYSTYITFNTRQGHVYQLPVTLTADNSILTVYPYLAAHRSRFQIVKDPSGDEGEPVLIPLNVGAAVAGAATLSRLSTVSSSSPPYTGTLAPTMTAPIGVESSIAAPESSSTSSGFFYPPTPRDGARNFPGGLTMEAAFVSGVFSTLNNDENGDAIPVEDWSEEQWFLVEVVATVRRWFSVHGWPGQPRPVSIPEGLRSALAAKGGAVVDGGAVGAGSWKFANNKKLASVLDCVSYLCGSPVPGIPVNSPVPSNPVERAKHLHWLYSTLIAFLTSQGALLGSVEPDALLEFDDFRRWHLIQLRLSGKREARNKEEEERENERLRAQFDVLSSQAWTDLLLQILKVFVLSRVRPRSGEGSVSAMGSNVYGPAEKVLLSWLNRHYEDQRHVVFAHLPEDERPSARWIVNFDLDVLDGLVIAVCLAAYAPYLVESHLKRLFPRPSSSIECYHNAVLVVEAIKTLDLFYDVQPRDFLVPNPLFFLLFCTHLYERLPSYVPKTRVQFDGVLSRSQERHVSLTNPARKLLVYNIRLAGSGASHFKIPSGNKIQVPSGQQISLSIQHTSRVLNEIEAVLLLTSHHESPARGRTLAFRLSASVSNVQPLAVFKCSTRLYEKCTVDVKVTNPFPHSTEYSVILIEETAFLSDDGDKKTGRLPDAFFTSTNALFVEPGSSASLVVTFLPLHFANRQCYILFSSPPVGEFIYSVEASVALPLPSVLPSVGTTATVLSSGRGADVAAAKEMTVRWQTAVGEENRHQLEIPMTNSIREAAIVQLAQLRMSTKEVRRRQVTGTLDCGTLTQAMAAMHVATSASITNEATTATTTFHVQASAEHFVVPKELTVPLAGNVFRLPVVFSAEAPGHYSCRLVLWSPHDVRVLLVECLVNQGPAQALFEFTTPALMSVVQDVPIVNTTMSDWELDACLECGDGFVGPPSVLVRAQSTTRYPLQFRPFEEGESNGVLTLTNRSDGCEYGRFELKGLGLAPKSLKKIDIQCQARHKTVYHLKVPNFTKKDLVLNVDSDLSFVSGSPDVAVRAGGAETYQLTLLPRRRGDYSGVVCFSVKNAKLDNRKTYRVWYDVQVVVDWPKPEGSIRLECAALDAVAADVPLTNSTSETVTYRVTLDGPGLNGPPSICLPENGTGRYEFVYEPKVAGKSKGMLVLEETSTLEEFWYELVLAAEPPKVRRLARMQAELGKSYLLSVQLDNPLNELLVLTCRCSNMKNFSIHAKDAKILIPARASASVDVEFTPSSLGESDHTADIIFSSKQLGEWHYVAHGVGLAPQTSHAFTVHAPIGGSGTGVIRFRNPLAHSVVVDIQLKERRGNSFFCLLTEKGPSGTPIGPKSFLEIPVSFSPDVMRIQEAEVIVFARRPNGDTWDHHWLRSAVEAVDGSAAKATDDMKRLYWVFEVRGVSEMVDFAPSQGPVLSCAARCRLENRVEVCLLSKLPESEGYVAAIARPVTPATATATATTHKFPVSERSRTESPDSVMELALDEKIENFTYRIVDNEASPAISSVGLSLVRKGIDARSGAVALIFNVVLAPSKPFKSVVWLEVCNEKSGIWRFPLRISVTEPQSDDVLFIEGTGLNQESRIGFRLNSQAQHPVPFRAFFAHGSDSEITVHPTAGELMPASANGTLFQIAYKPKIYGKPHQAKLIIQTSSSQWTYDIHGTQPSYSPPYDAKPLSPTRWTLEPIIRRRRRNFVRENLEVQQTGISSTFKGAPLLTFTTRK